MKNNKEFTQIPRSLHAVGLKATAKSFIMPCQNNQTPTLAQTLQHAAAA